MAYFEFYDMGRESAGMIIQLNLTLPDKFCGLEEMDHARMDNGMTNSSIFES